MTAAADRHVEPDADWQLPIIPPPGAGIVTPSCTDRNTRYPVVRHVGRMLRIGGEASLCFACGPEGGVYHPADGYDSAHMTFEQVKKTAELIFLHDGDGSEPPTAAEMQAFDVEMRRAFGVDGAL